MAHTPAKSASVPVKEDETKKDDAKTTKSLNDLIGNKDNKETDKEDGKRDPADSIGPEGDPNNTSYVYPKDIKPPVDNTDKNVTWATPDEISHMTPQQTAERYGIDNKVSDEDFDNPKVQVYRDQLVDQVPSGTHLHPDVAKDLLNRGVAETHTDNAQVKRTIIDVYDFAPDAEQNDKFVAPPKEDKDEDEK